MSSPSSSQPRHVVIVGGGVIGAACAHYLTGRGLEVTIIEQETFGSACSHGNCGYVSPSHVLPLAEPGAVKKTLKAMISANSPFKIKPRFDLTLWAWLAKFARRCNERDMLAAGRSIHALLLSSMGEYRKLVETEPLDCEWEERGLLFAYRTREQFDAYEKTNALLTEAFDEPATKLNAEELVELEPALQDGLAGAYHYTDDTHLRADRLMASWRSLLESRGVTILERRSMTGLNSRGGEAVAITTRRNDETASANGSEEEIEADAFVLATGALTPLLQKYVGCRIAIQPGKGYSLTMPRPKICPRIPILFQEDKVGVTPFQSGYRLGSTMEFAGYDSTIRESRLQLLIDGAKRYLRDPVSEPIEEKWFGWRPMTIDSLPFIDRSPKLSNLWVAAGHNMLGLSMAPGTGKLVAELVTGEQPHLDPTPYALGR